MKMGTAAISPASTARGLNFRTKLVLGVCGLVLFTGAIVLWLAHRSERASTEALTGSIFREVSGRAATHTRAFVLRAAPVVESLAQLADQGLAIDDPDHLAPQLLAVLKANPGLSWVSYSNENGSFTGANRPPEGDFRINRSHIVGGKTQLMEHEVLPDGSLKLIRSDLDSVKGDQFGKDRLRDVIREESHRTAEEIAQKLRERLASFHGDAKAVDDVTFVIIKIPANGSTD